MYSSQEPEKCYSDCYIPLRCPYGYYPYAFKDYKHDAEGGHGIDNVVWEDADQQYYSKYGFHDCQCPLHVHWRVHEPKHLESGIEAVQAEVGEEFVSIGGYSNQTSGSVSSWSNGICSVVLCEPHYLPLQPVCEHEEKPLCKHIVSSACSGFGYYSLCHVTRDNGDEIIATVAGLLKRYLKSDDH